MKKLGLGKDTAGALPIGLSSTYQSEIRLSTQAFYIWWCFPVSKSLLGIMKWRKLSNVQLFLESLAVILKYWFVEHGLLFSLHSHISQTLCDLYFLFVSLPTSPSFTRRFSCNANQIYETNFAIDHLTGCRLKSWMAHRQTHGQTDTQTDRPKQTVSQISIEHRARKKKGKKTKRLYGKQAFYRHQAVKKRSKENVVCIPTSLFNVRPIKVAGVSNFYLWKIW